VDRIALASARQSRASGHTRTARSKGWLRWTSSISDRICQLDASLSTGGSHAFAACGFRVNLRRGCPVDRRVQRASTVAACPQDEAWDPGSRSSRQNSILCFLALHRFFPSLSSQVQYRYRSAMGKMASCPMLRGGEWPSHRSGSMRTTRMSPPGVTQHSTDMLACQVIDIRVSGETRSGTERVRQILGELSGVGTWVGANAEPHGSLIPKGM
jgi:hypothetical protein